MLFLFTLKYHAVRRSVTYLFILNSAILRKGLTEEKKAAIPKRFASQAVTLLSHVIDNT